MPNTMEIFQPVIREFSELCKYVTEKETDTELIGLTTTLAMTVMKAKTEFEALDLSSVITEGAAKEFYRDLCGSIYGDANKTAQGIMSSELIADHMRIPVWKAEAFLNACRNYGITERQGGAWVV